MRRGALARIMAALLLCGLLAGTPAGAEEIGEDSGAPAVPRLAEPGGGHLTGSEPPRPEDRDRPAPWLPGEHRGLTVTVWRPAAEPPARPAPYAPPAESAASPAVSAIPLPPETLSTVVAHLPVRAPPAERPGGRPLMPRGDPGQISGGQGPTWLRGPGAN